MKVNQLFTRATSKKEASRIMFLNWNKASDKYLAIVDKKPKLKEKALEKHWQEYLSTKASITLAYEEKIKQLNND